MKISKTIRKLRLSHNMTQAEFGKIAGVSDKAVSTWENGTAEPRMGSIQRIADHFGILKSEIIEGKPAPNLIEPAAHAIPILGEICAGDGVVAEQAREGMFYIDQSVGADYGLRVHGDSMTGAGIHDGDLAFIRKDFEYVDGEIYAVVFGDDPNASLKKVFREGGHAILQPCNPAYKPIIEPPDGLTIVGELVGVYHPVKR